MKRTFATCIFLAIYAIIFLFFQRLATIRTIEYLWKDSLFTIRGDEPVSHNVVVVAIDEPSFREIGLQWPWPRSLHAKLISSLNRAGAKAIAFDILFVEPSKDPHDDKILANALKRYDNVVLGMAFSMVKRKNYVQSIPVIPIDLLAQNSPYLGVVNFFPDEDGIIRRGYKNFNKIPSLALAAVSAAKMNEKAKLCHNSFLIDFKGPEGTIPIISYYQALNQDKFLPPKFLKDKIVFVGFASEAAVEVERGAVDAFPTPYFRLSRKLMFGVEIHAQTAITLLEGCPLKEWNGDNWTSFLVFCVLLIIALRVKDYPWKLSAFVLVCTLLTFLLSLVLFIRFKIIYTPLSSTIGFLISSTLAGTYSFAITVKERSFLRKAFSLYVSSDLVSEIVRNPELLSLGGERREISILFSDIRNFTSISEKTDPEILTKLLNLYFSRMTKEIFKEKGTLDKFIGDAIMAIFGAPLPFEDHAVRACRAALNMIKALEDVREIWKNSGVELNIGIGINTGIAVVGNLGSEERFDYTAIGDSVNLASRLEGLCKLYGVNVICSEYTVKKAKDEFQWRKLDFVRVKGKKEPIEIYELKEIKTPQNLLYEEALELYRKGSFNEALYLFKKALENDPNDYPSKLMYERTLYLLKNPPHQWDGVWEIRSK